MTDEHLLLKRQPADGATMGAIYVMTLTVVPANLVLRGIPLALTPANVVALVMTICWLFAHFTTTLGMTKGRNPVRTALYLFLVSVLSTYCYVMYRYLPSDEINSADHSLVLIVALVGIALMVGDGVRGRHRLDLLLRAVVIGCTCVAFVGALQFVLGFDLSSYLALPGLRSTAKFGYVFERAGFRRVAGTTGNPIEFGVICAMILPLALYYGFRGRARGGAQWPWWACSALIGAGLLFSVSRSAVLGICCVAVILFLGWPARRRVGALVVSMVFLGLTKIAIPGLLSAIYSLFSNFSNDSSIQYRTHDYPVAAAEIAKSLWLGRGFGTFYAPKYLVFDNQYLLALVEGGVIGLATMIGLFLVGLLTAFRAMLRTADTELRDLALTLTACLIVPIVGAITFDLLSFKTVTGMLFILLGAVCSLSRTVRGEAGAPVKSRGSQVDRQ